MIQTLYHVTLTTGHARSSPRSECNTQFINELKSIVMACERDGTAEFPSPTGLMQLTRIADDDPSSGEVAIWSMSEPGGPSLATIVVAMTQVAGASVWRTLHTHHGEPLPLATQSDDPPPAPWLGAILHLAALLPSAHPAIAWMGGAERCIAWAWIESVHAGR